jgi:IclR family pca regulon transcriptional regulator
MNVDRPDPPPSFTEGPDYVKSLARGLTVLRSFDAFHPAMTLSALAARSGLSRAATRRSLLTLQHEGYVGIAGRDFFLLPRVLDLGFAYLASLKLPELAMPEMEALSRRVDESCSLSVLDGHDIVYVARVPVRKVVSVTLGVGARLPAHAASMGRVLLAGFDDEPLEQWLAVDALRPLTPLTIRTRKGLRREIAVIRRQGYAIVDREYDAALLSVAVPIRDRGNRVIAALNVGTGYSPDAEKRARERFLPALFKAQKNIEWTLAHQLLTTGS